MVFHLIADIIGDDSLRLKKQAFDMCERLLFLRETTDLAATVRKAI